VDDLSIILIVDCLSFLIVEAADPPEHCPAAEFIARTFDRDTNDAAGGRHLAVLLRDTAEAAQIPPLLCDHKFVDRAAITQGCVHVHLLWARILTDCPTLLSQCVAEYAESLSEFAIELIR
jgi:hypothetical protein